MPDQNKQLNTIDNTYLYKKTEKLVSALYLLTNFLSDKEPIKWQLRETSLGLLSVSQGQFLNPQKATSLCAVILSFLGIANLSSLISEMNYSIMKYEFESLVKLLESNGQGNASGSTIFPEHFFEINETKSNTLAIASKGQNIMSDRLSFKNNQIKQKDKTNRQDLIISLLKKNAELGIKDFTTAIKDCSEKTIQRELATLVSKGQVKKDGEKRWSRYSLK